MNTRTKIKVIKKGTVKIIEPTAVNNKDEETNSVSNLASTVSDWITEFQHRRRQETESAIERFKSDFRAINTVFNKI